MKIADICNFPGLQHRRRKAHLLNNSQGVASEIAVPGRAISPADPTCIRERWLKSVGKKRLCRLTAHRMVA